MMISQGKSQTDIATTLGKDKSVISREITRNRDQRNGEYRFDLAVKKARERQKMKNRDVRFTTEMQIRDV